MDKFTLTLIKENKDFKVPLINKLLSSENPFVLHLEIPDYLQKHREQLFLFFTFKEEGDCI